MKLPLCVFSFLLALLSSSMEAPLLRGGDLKAEGEGEGEGREGGELIDVVLVLDVLIKAVEKLETKRPNCRKSLYQPSSTTSSSSISPSSPSPQKYEERTPLFYWDAPEDIRSPPKASGRIGATFLYLCDHNLVIAKEVLGKLEGHREVQRKEELFKRYQQQLRALAWAFIDFDSEKIRRVRAEVFGLELLAAMGVKDPISVKEREALEKELYEPLSGSQSVLSNQADRFRILGNMAEMDFTISAFLRGILPADEDFEEVREVVEGREVYAACSLSLFLWREALPSFQERPEPLEALLSDASASMTCLVGRKDSRSEGPSLFSAGSSCCDCNSSSPAAEGGGQTGSLLTSREEEERIKVQRRIREDAAEVKGRAVAASMRARRSEYARLRLVAGEKWFVKQLSRGMADLEKGNWEVSDAEQLNRQLEKLKVNISDMGGLAKCRARCGLW